VRPPPKGGAWHTASCRSREFPKKMKKVKKTLDKLFSAFFHKSRCNGLATALQWPFSIFQKSHFIRNLLASSTLRFSENAKAQYDMVEAC